MAMAGAMVGIASTLYGAYKQNQSDQTQADASEQQGAYQKRIYDLNASSAEQSAADAIKNGDINAERLQTSARGTIGAQRNSFAGQGVDVGSGSAAEVGADTVQQSGIDAATIRGNAWKQAFGLRSQAQNERLQGDYALASGKSQAAAYRTSGGSTLATGGLRAAGQFADYYDRQSSLRQPSVGAY